MKITVNQISAIGVLMNNIKKLDVSILGMVNLIKLNKFGKDCNAIFEENTSIFTESMKKFREDLIIQHPDKADILKEYFNLIRNPENTSEFVNNNPSLNDILPDLQKSYEKLNQVGVELGNKEYEINHTINISQLISAIDKAKLDTTLVLALGFLVEDHIN